MIAADANTTIDTAIDLRNGSNQIPFTLEGGGAVTISSDKGTWGTANFGKELVVQPLNNGVTNPSIALADANASNYFAITNNGGVFTISGMAALSDTVTAPVQGLQIAHNTGVVTFPQIVNFGSPFVTKAYTIAGLPACGASILGAIANVSNGTAYGVGTYGSAVSATGAVTRVVVCTNTAGATTYAWAYN